jgi:hypothetical protein
VGPKRRIQSEGLVALTGTRRRSDGDKVSAGVDIDQIVGEGVAIEIGKRGGGTERRNPRRDAFETGMHLAHELVRRIVRDFRKRKSFETEATSKAGHFGRGQRRQSGENITNSHQEDCSEAAEMLVHHELRC